MPRKQIYVREEDEKMFERAVELAGEESLSATVAEAVRRFVEQEEAKAKGFGTVVLEVGSGRRTAANWKKVRFQGRLLVEGCQSVRDELRHDPVEGYTYTQRVWDDVFWSGCHPVRSKDLEGLWMDTDRLCFRQLYMTSKGKFLLYTQEFVREDEQCISAQYQVFESLDHVREAEGVPLEMLEMAATALDEELVEDLDV